MKAVFRVRSIVLCSSFKNSKKKVPIFTKDPRGHAGLGLNEWRRKRGMWERRAGKTRKGEGKQDTAARRPRIGALV